MDGLVEVLGTYLVALGDIDELINKGVIGGRVLVEAPLGFKELGIEIVKYLSSRGLNASLSGRNTWGACDFSPVGNYDTVIHLGHALPPNILRVIGNNFRVRRGEYGSVVTLNVEGGPNVVFVPVYYKPQPELIARVEGLIRSIADAKDITVAYALPYTLYARRIAEAFGLKLMPRPITGCFVDPPIPSSVLFVGSGYFYPLTFKFLRPSTRVYLLDVFRGVVEDVEYVYRRYLSMKVKALEGFRNARRVGIVISRKPGQYRQDVVEPLIRRLRELGKDYVIIDSDEVSPDVINNLPVDAVVNTACPRVGIDDLDRVLKPIVNVGDVLKRNMLDLNNLLIW